MASAIIGIDITEWNHEKASTRAIFLETGGELQVAAPYLLTLVSGGDWKPGTELMIYSGREEMDSLINGGSIKSLGSRVRTYSDQRYAVEKTRSKEDWDKERKNHDHAYLFSWRMATLYYQGRALPKGKDIYELSNTLLGKFN